MLTFTNIWYGTCTHYDFFRFYVEIDHQKTSYSTQYFLKSLFQEMI